MSPVMARRAVRTAGALVAGLIAAALPAAAQEGAVVPPSDLGEAGYAALVKTAVDLHIRPPTSSSPVPPIS